ncbi:AAA family ATPase [Pseudomonas aeruginosa]|uniref:AAA family ATPase n=5 Tax=Pseudomonas aeruginosa TaxID=287 RepID=UPI00071BD8A2|nr:AAA family ATPase [Pseudomonas aeruginosa]KSJ14052.1 cell division protein [Pseudomonas aeruginosa]MDC3991614.1 AAA family ATPase [Pseudomonas aeruginosa]
MTSLHADEAFLGHYQFSHDPFAPRVPGFKFFPAQRKPVLGQLHHLARYSQLLLLVTGPLGSGKTLLRQALVASTNKDAVLSVVISARTAADETSLLRQVAQGLSINQASLEAILTKVAQLAITGQDVYLMVDDAEQLQDSALEVLLLLASGTNEGRLHVFLFGEPSLLPRLEVFSEGEERFHAIELQPYSEEETRDYLAQRLEGAGQGIELISNDLLVDIHEQSEGWPGAINQVARDALIEAMLANRGAARKATGGSFNLPKKHLVILAVVAIGVIAAWFMQGKSKPEAPQTASTELSMNGGGTPAQAQQPGSGPAVEFNGSSQPLPLPLVGESQPVIREPLAQAAGQGGDDEGGLPSAAVPPTVSSSAPPVTPLANNGVTPMHPVPPAPTEPTAPAATPTPAQTPAPAAPVASAPASKPAPAPAPAKPVASKPATTAAAKPAPAPAAKPASGGGAGSQWYRNQSGGNFALQILGTGSEANAQAFIRQQGGGDFRYFKKTLQGKPFYVVTYGSFPNRAAALAAVKKLPSKVQAGKPWPRTFASIQQEIGQAH